MTRKRYKLIVSANAVAGQEAAFNEWYDKTHLADVLKVPGFVGAQRYRMIAELSGEPLYRYCAIYEVETDDPKGAVEALQARAGSADMPLSEALAPQWHAALYEETVRKP